MPRRTRRIFTPEFKARVVLELISGQRSQAELCRQHQLSPSLLTLWKDTFVERLHLLFREDARAGQEQPRVAELEQLVGRQPLELELLKKPSPLPPATAPRNTP